jgi:hypothetical protein
MDLRLPALRRSAVRKGSKSLHEQPEQLLTILLRQELMPRTRYGEQFRLCRDEFQCLLHLGKRAESIASAVHEEGGRLQEREVRPPNLNRPPPRLQRGGE